MRPILIFMLLVVLNYVSCKVMDSSSLREDTNDEDEEDISSDESKSDHDAGDDEVEDEESISCDDWEPDYAYSDDSTSCENQKLWCDDDTKDMVKSMEEFLEDPQDAD